MDNNKPEPEENQSSPKPQDDDLPKPIFDHATSLPEEPVPTQETPKTIFETVTEESATEKPTVPQEPAMELKPEEVPPELASPEEISFSSAPPPPQEPPSSDDSSFLEGNRRKYLIIGSSALVFLILFVTILAFFLRGKTPQETSLIYWGLWDEKENIQPLIDQYQARNKNVKIQYVKMTPSDYRLKLIERSKRGEGPDIFRFHNTWVAEMREILAPLPQSVMSNVEFEQTFYPIHKKDFKIGDNYYALPLMIDGLVLIYNENLFKKAGIENAPGNWEDILNIVTKLTVKNKEGKVVTAGIALGTASNVEHFSDIFGLFLVQNGGDIRRLDRPEAAGALESYRKFAELPNNVWDEAMPNSITAFTQEKVAMIIVPSWEALAIKAENPEIKLKVVPVPSIPGSDSVSIATYWAEGVSRLSKNQTEAWKFLKFLTNKENMTARFQLQSKSRLFGEAYSRVDLRSVLAQNEYLGPVIEQADSYVSLPTISRTFDSGMNDEIISYLRDAINRTAEGVSYQSALQTANDGVAQVLTKYKVK